MQILRNVPRAIRSSSAAALVAILLSGGAVAGEPYAFRGVIFGPYGRPWSHTDRVDMLRWMGAHGMNIYIHAAKDDVYQRLQWRDPYPTKTLDEFAEEIEAARFAGVAWVSNISPGFPLIPSATLPDGTPSQDICFSCAEDLEALIQKLKPFYDLGVGIFMVSFDDVQKISTHPEDALAFGVGDEAYGRMTATLLNQVKSGLQSLGSQPVTVLTVPADYSGTTQTAYLKSFGETLDPQVRVMWTGTATVSREIRAMDAQAYGDAISTEASGKRKLLIWDNFPVNDYNGNIFSSTGLATNFKLNVGPYKGRRADLMPFVDGFLSNPMNEAQASKIPLYTVAAYLNDPATYTDDPVPGGCPYDSDVTMNDKAGCLSEEAWRAGIEEFGDAAAGPLLDFVSQMRSTPTDRTESPVFVELWTAFREAFPGAFWKESWIALVAELAAESNAAPALRTGGLPNAKFFEETRNHLAQLEQNARVGLLAAEMLAAQRPGLYVAPLESGSPGTARLRGAAFPVDPVEVLRLLAELEPEEVEMRLSPYSVHGDRFQHDLGAVYVGENRMDDFVDFAHQVTAQWLPTSAVAARGPLTVTVNGSSVPVGVDGSFEAEVPTNAMVVVVVTDAAGYRTGERR